jgi:hypothetical protein
MGNRKGELLMKVTITVMKDKDGKYSAKYQTSVGSGAMARYKDMKNVDEISEHLTDILEDADSKGLIGTK